jgi:DNA-binding transcriptional regulator YiaG
MSGPAATLSGSRSETSSGEATADTALADLVRACASWTSAGVSASGAFRRTQRALVPTVIPVQALLDATNSRVLVEGTRTAAIFAGHVTGSGILMARPRPSRVRQATEMPPRDARSTAELVRDLWERSGLTWDQLARLFGVSRRAVHAWATGARPNAYHQELLSELTQIVASIDTGDPHRNRELLLAPRPERLSWFDEVRVRHADQASDIAGTLSPAQLLGALHDRGPGDNVD